MNGIYHRVSIRRYQDIIKTFGGVKTKENVEQILEEEPVPLQDGTCHCHTFIQECDQGLVALRDVHIQAGTLQNGDKAMNKLMPDVIKYYDREVTALMSEKYGFGPMEALRAFLSSQTHAMLEDRDFGMTDFGPFGVFDIWEAERVTGNPRNSVYIRAE